MNKHLLDILAQIDDDATVHDVASCCTHANVDETDRRVCLDCGQLLNDTDSYICHQINGVGGSSSSTLHRNNNSNNNNNPSINKYKRKTKTSTGNAIIYSYIPQYVSRQIKDRALEIYKSMTENKFYRSAFRKSIVIACVYKASIELNERLNIKDLFYKLSSSINTQTVNKGLIYMSNTAACDLTYYALNSDEIYISSLLKDIIINDRSLLDVAEIISLSFTYIKTNCDIIKSSHYKSIICALTYFYLTKIVKTGSSSSIEGHVTITIDEFSRQCKISKNTLEKKTRVLGDFYTKKMAKLIFFAYLQRTCAADVTTTTILSTGGKCLLSIDTSAMTITRVDNGANLPLDCVTDVMEWNKLYSMDRSYDGRSLYDCEFTRYVRCGKNAIEFVTTNDTQFLNNAVYDAYVKINS